MTTLSLFKRPFATGRRPLAIRIAEDKQLLAIARAAGDAYNAEQPGREWTWDGHNAAVITAVLEARR
jgi:hypothetical protein